MEIGEITEVYAFCDKCSQNILLKLSEEQMKDRKGGLLSVVSVHGQPKHAVLFFLDSNLRVRSCEPANLMMDLESEKTRIRTPIVIETETKKVLSLDELISFFGGNKKQGITNLSDFLMQIMIQNNTYLVNNDTKDGELLSHQINDLLSKQGFLPEIIENEKEDSKIKGRFPAVFDLSKKKFLVPGIKVDSNAIEQIIKEFIDLDNAFLKLKFEVSKIFFSYGLLREILKKTTEKYLDTRLAKEISIDLQFIPLLQKMAMHENVDAQNRIEYDGLGRAVRSF